ncbi:MAG: DUF4886 domain-containing protein, partial [Treponema sp.]|nr:DUF4886 domain-containing protein [Treponema sp.]
MVFSLAACPGGGDPANPAVPGNPGNPVVPGEPPSLEGSWYSAEYSETFTFDVAAGTFTKMSDRGWGEGGTFTFTANSVTCIITQVYDGGTWKDPNPGNQLVWVRPYKIQDNTLILYGTNVYVKVEPAPEPSGAAPYRILAIGNSYSMDALRYLRDMLVENNVADSDIVIVNAYIGGQTLAGHAVSAQNNTPDYTRQSFGTGGAVKTADNVTLKDIIASCEFDYITLQQASVDSGKPDTYKDSEIAYLIGFIKEHSTNPNVKIGWHMTWAYAGNYDNAAFDGYGRDQTAMYEAIAGTVQEKIAPNAEFEFIIPAGTAIQNARTGYGDTLDSDGTHLNDKGRFIAAAMWLKEIYGKDACVMDYYFTLDGFLSGADIANIQKCVDDAYAKPFEVTAAGWDVPVPHAIYSPYAGVDWGAYGQYKAGLHTHTTRSDGLNTLAAMVEEYYSQDYDILAITDHSVLNNSWTETWEFPGISYYYHDKDGTEDVPLAESRYEEIAGGAGRGGRGMLRIQNTNEQSNNEADHLNTYFAPFNNDFSYDTFFISPSGNMKDNIAKTEELGGISHINHPGRYTGNNSTNPAHIKRYVDLFMEFESCVGMEIINQTDRYSNDRILWDNILAVTVPLGRYVWGFSNDDAHSTT